MIWFSGDTERPLTIYDLYLLNPDLVCVIHYHENDETLFHDKSYYFD